MDPFEVRPFDPHPWGTGLVPSAEASAAHLMGLAPELEAHVGRADRARAAGVAELSAGAGESERHMYEVRAYLTDEEARQAGGTLEGADVRSLLDGRLPQHPGEADQPPPGYYLADNVTATARSVRPGVDRERQRGGRIDPDREGRRGGGEGRPAPPGEPAPEEPAPEEPAPEEPAPPPQRRAPEGRRG